MLQWQWSSFSELTVYELYTILMLRQQVFIVEQQCPYMDADGKDLLSFHLLGWQTQPEQKQKLVAYLRVVPPQLAHPEMSMGRILVAPKVRNQGIGKKLMEEAIRKIAANFGVVPIRISAQQYLKKFYEGFGFRQVGEPFDEDGILHIEMLRK